jgi:hypothetical protein
MDNARFVSKYLAELPKKTRTGKLYESRIKKTISSKPFSIFSFFEGGDGLYAGIKIQ